MRAIRITVSIALTLVAAVLSILALSTAEGAVVRSTIEKSRSIDENFRAASRHLESRLEREGRLPTPEDFAQWADTFPSRPYTINGIRMLIPPLPEEFKDLYGTPPIQGYVLTYWRGEWFESYASWTQKSSLSFDEEAYYLFGNSSIEAAITAALALLAAWSAVKLWPPRRNAA